MKNVASPFDWRNFLIRSGATMTPILCKAICITMECGGIKASRRVSISRLTFNGTLTAVSRQIAASTVARVSFRASKPRKITSAFVPEMPAERAMTSCHHGSSQRVISCRTSFADA